MSREAASVRQVVRRCLLLLPGGQRRRWTGLVVLAFVATVVESAGAVVVLVVMGLLTGAETIDVPFIAMDVQDPFNDQGLLDVTVFVAAVGGFFIFRAALLLGQSYVQNRVVQGTGVKLSSELLDGYLRMPYETQLRRDSAQLIRNAFTSVSDVVGAVLSPLVLAFSEALLVIGIVAVLVATAPAASLLALGVLSPLLFLLLRGVQPRLAALGEISHQSHHATLRWLQQGLEGLREIKLFHQEAYVRERFEESRSALSRALYLRATLVDAPRLMLETILLFFVLTLLTVSVVRATEVQESLSFLGLIAYAALRVTPSVNRIVANLNSIRFGGAAVSEVHADLTMIRDAIDSHVVSIESERSLDFRYAALKDVDFRYSNSESNVLTDISFNVGKGEFIGIVGVSGSGKSTLVDLILGLIDPTSGSISINGVDISDCRREWQRCLGVVPQTVFLLDDTIARNVAFADSARQIDSTRLGAALEASRLEALVDTLPLGIETPVGQRGTRLSGGERQRVAIARALYRRPQVLIFDEGTSALDAVTETAVLEGVRRTYPGLTMITVSHRVATLKECDRIILLDHGRVVQTGRYHELMKDSLLFSDLVSRYEQEVIVGDARVPRRDEG